MCMCIWPLCIFSDYMDELWHFSKIANTYTQANTSTYIHIYICICTSVCIEIETTIMWYSNKTTTRAAKSITSVYVYVWVSSVCMYKWDAGNMLSEAATKATGIATIKNCKYTGNKLSAASGLRGLERKFRSFQVFFFVFWDWVWFFFLLFC